MAIWILLFLVILIISFILALRSMGDYQEVADRPEHPLGVFLVQNPEGFSKEVLDSFYSLALMNNQFLSFERLFKGTRNALVLSGPAELLANYKEQLNLLEIEDYSQKIDTSKAGDFDGTVSAWEVGAKSSAGSIQLDQLMSYVPDLSETDEFWWQIVAVPAQLVRSFKSELVSAASVVTGGKSDGLLSSNKGKDSLPEFKTVIRAVVTTSDLKILQKLKDDLSKIGQKEGLSALPQIYSSADVIKMYQNRSLPLGKLMNLDLKKHKGRQILTLDSKQLQSLIGV